MLKFCMYGEDLSKNRVAACISNVPVVKKMSISKADIFKTLMVVDFYAFKGFFPYTL